MIPIYGRTVNILVYIVQALKGQKGFFVQPTIVTGLSPDTPIVQSETFAPIVYVFKAKVCKLMIYFYNTSICIYMFRKRFLNFSPLYFFLLFFERIFERIFIITTFIHVICTV